LRFDRWVVAAVICASAGCVQEEIIQPHADAVLVHAVLDMDARDQFVIVQSTTGALDGQRAVSGATVTITAPDGRVLVADEIRDTVRSAPFDPPPISPLYRISLDRFGVTLVGGGTYRLKVVLPGAREVSGVTTLPAFPPVKTVTTTPQVFVAARDTLTLAWPRVTNAHSYEINVSTSSQVTFSMFTDTSVALTRASLGDNGARPFWSGQQQQVVVNAVDVNYYDYYRRSSDLITGSGVVNHLEGATGVFGSIVRVSSRVLDVR
jgi:hypothetical protein